MVRLEAIFALLERFAREGFNSSMVRLKGRVGLRHRKDKKRFNSSMVRLEVPLQPVPSGVCHKFQFQYGSIRSETINILCLICYWGFNSSMVRLEASAKTTPNSPNMRFNSSMVRLEGSGRLMVTLPGCRVSIPVWFD